jgi:uroporphyrin-3 C-methyltransferase
MPDQALLIKQQLLLQLEQARLAVVQADEGMYEVTLDQLQTIMDRYLIQDNPMAAQLLSDLAALRDVEITTTLPSLAESANRVRQLAVDSATSGGEVGP